MYNVIYLTKSIGINILTITVLQYMLNGHQFYARNIQKCVQFV